jgi:hypothetical protein
MYQLVVVVHSYLCYICQTLDIFSFPFLKKKIVCCCQFQCVVTVALTSRAWQMNVLRLTDFHDECTAASHRFPTCTCICVRTLLLTCFVCNIDIRACSREVYRTLVATENDSRWYNLSLVNYWYSCLDLCRRTSHDHIDNLTGRPITAAARYKGPMSHTTAISQANKASRNTRH